MERGGKMKGQKKRILTVNELCQTTMHVRVQEKIDKTATQTWQLRGKHGSDLQGEGCDVHNSQMCHLESKEKQVRTMEEWKSEGDGKQNNMSRRQ